MKRFLDYKPTKEELRRVIDDDEDFVKSTLEEFDQAPGGDNEKRYIARLLFIRGLEKESWGVLETIEDAEYRVRCQEEEYRDWVKWSWGMI